LVYHSVDGFGGAQKFSLKLAAINLQSHVPREVALGYRVDHSGRFAYRMCSQSIRALIELTRSAIRRWLAEGKPFLNLSFLANDPANAAQFSVESAIIAASSLKVSATCPATPVQAPANEHRSRHVSGP